MSRPFRIVIRADASALMGAGHLMRCLALALELKRRGCDVSLVSRSESGRLLDRFRTEGFDVHELRSDSALDESRDAAGTIAGMGSAADWLVVDHYGLGMEWEAAMRPFTRHILAIDDLARAHDCDVLLDQNWFGASTGQRYDHLSGCSCLLGPRFALLQPEFAALHGRLPARDRPPRRILICFGGGDPTNETMKALDALSDQAFADCAIDVVLGPTQPAADVVVATAAARSGTTIHQNVPSLAGLMARADYSLGAGGVMVWERLCLGLPGAVTITADNQAESIGALAEIGYVRSLGKAAAVTSQHYAMALREPAPLPAAASRLVDGLGAARCADVIMHGARAALEEVIR